MQRKRSVSAVVAVAVAAVGLLASCAAGPGSGSGGPDGSGRIGVVAGENFWGSIARQIGGDRVSVTSIISDPDADPHAYESNATDAAALSSAALVIENGLGYDDFMAKLLDASPSSDRAVLSVQRVLGVTGRDANPHVWYDTARMPAVAHAIAQQLSRISPADADEFRANEQRFDASLKPIESVIAEIERKYAGTEVAYTERVPGYLVSAAGLALGMPAGFTEAVEQGEEPSPRDDLAFQRAITSGSVRVLIVNAQVVDDQTERITRIAEDAGVPVVGMTETIPPSDATYQSWQLRQAEALLAALGG